MATGGRGFAMTSRLSMPQRPQLDFRDARAHALLKLLDGERRNRGARDPALVGLRQIDADDILDVPGQPLGQREAVTKSSRSVGLAIMTA